MFYNLEHVLNSKMFVRIAKRADPDQTASSEAV